MLRGENLAPCVEHVDRVAAGFRQLELVLIETKALLEEAA